MVYHTLVILDCNKTSVFLALVVTLLSKLTLNQISRSKLYKFPPSPSRIPILGHVHHVYGDGRAAFNAICKFLKIFKGNPITVDLIHRRYVLLTSAHHAEIVLKSTALKSNDYKTVKALMGHGQTGNKPTLPTFVDALLEEYNPDEEGGARQILDEVMTVLVGGQETTATELSFALVMLAMHPREQEKVYQEISQVLKDRSEKEVTLDDLTQLKYLDCVINETLRLFPALPLVSRELLETTDFGDCVLPKGLAVPIFIYETHRKPEVWQFPEEFRPSRFASSDTAKRSQFSYIPFASGLRYCVGQKYALLQMKTVLCTILRYFRVATAPGLEKMSDIQLEVNTTLKIYGGFNVVCHRRRLWETSTENQKKGRGSSKIEKAKKRLERVGNEKKASRGIYVRPTESDYTSKVISKL
ncbi:hypothetical protein LSTR_LSTR007103 [Laodelphax striatellus]|uniref:Cytochrome P450 n=1 Tax=Laodelphax striatellus TaxID=195883 RepID=A0A482WEM7_LAOST|nr:hypothetical protein LSTR_LSTR007103 [Laodelphax striatellus]